MANGQLTWSRLGGWGTLPAGTEVPERITMAEFQALPGHEVGLTKAEAQARVMQAGAGEEMPVGVGVGAGFGLDLLGAGIGLLGGLLCEEGSQFGARYIRPPLDTPCRKG